MGGGRGRGVEETGDEKEHGECVGGGGRWGEGVMFGAGSGISDLAKPAIKILAAAEYYEAWKYVPVLALSMVFTAFTSFLGTVYVVTKQSGISYLTEMARAAIKNAPNFLFIHSTPSVHGAGIHNFIRYSWESVILHAHKKKSILIK